MSRRLPVILGLEAMEGFASGDVNSESARRSHVFGQVALMLLLYCR